MSAILGSDPGLRARLRRGAGVALTLVLVGVAVAVLVTAVTPHGSAEVIAQGATTSDQPTEVGSSAPDPTATDVIYVHILGQVARPGLYQLRAGDRAVDAVAAAGGFTAAADPGAVNLARFLTDGEQIVVPAVGERVPAGGTAGSGAVGSGAKVNLNTADAATLDTLPNVGPAIAQRIIAWREQNGRFVTIEDLLDVSGIGASTFDALKDLVTV